MDIQACSASMDILKLRPSDLDPLVDGVEGVAAFYINAGDGQISSSRRLGGRSAQGARSKDLGNLEIKLRVDASGLSCPLPILKASQGIKSIAAGELLEVIATDPGSVKDFAAWAGSTGNALVEQDVTDGKFRFVLRHK